MATAIAKPLAGYRVLVTRPEGQAQALIDAIRQAGGEAWPFPLLTITALDNPEQQQACKQRIMALDQYQQVIFVSTNAVQFGMEWIADYWPQLPVGIHWHGVGASTCRAMARAGLPVTTEFDIAHPMTSEALLASPDLQTLHQQKVLIIRGVGGREYLLQQLGARGARVDIAECYQRQAPEVDREALLQLLNTQHIGTICINSGDSLLNLCVLMGDKLSAILGLRLIVPSQRVSQLAQRRGFASVSTAANASDAEVLQALIVAGHR